VLRLAILLSLSLAAIPLPGSSARAPEAAKPATPPSVEIEMRNVHLHVDEGIVLAVRRLRGRLESRMAGRPPVFDDGRSYVLNVDQGEISIGMRSLERLLNTHVFAYRGAPLEDIHVRPTGDGRLEQTAKLHKGITVPVSMKASVAATPDGQLRMRVESMKTAGVPTRGLLKLFGLELDDVVNLEKGRGVTVRDDDLVISLGQVLPPPEMRGRLSAAFVRGDELVQIIGEKRNLPELTRPDPKARNYVYFHGSDIRFGKLTMSDADLQLIDADPSDPFDFFPERYKAQLVAGYSKNTPSGGLRTYMPDYGDLKATRRVDLRPR
jgi:hypothetical protein